MLPNPASYDTYGGEKVDYQPAEDPTTDRSADQEDEAFADVSAMTRMVARAYVAFTTNGTTCTVIDSDAVWGGSSSPAPLSITRTGAGAYTITWPASITDARGNTQNVSLRRGLGNTEAAGFAMAVARSAPNVFTAAVRTLDTNTATDPSGVMIVVVW